MITDNHRPPIPQTDLLILLDNGQPVFARELATGPPQTATRHTAQANAVATREHSNPQVAYFRIIQPKTGGRVLQPVPPPRARKGLVVAIGAYNTDQIQQVKHAIEAHLRNPDFSIFDLHPRNAQPPRRGRPCSGTGHRQQHGGHDDQPTAVQRLADAFGWSHVPELTPDEQRCADLEFDTAQAQARRLYGLESEQFERGWDAALDLAIELVRTARRDAQHRLRQLVRQVRTNQEPT